jgi:hypothetical protein
MTDQRPEVISQVERTTKLSTERGWSQTFFPEGHPLTRLVPGRWTRICESLSAYDINLQFNQSSDADDPRSIFRLDYASLLGPGMDLLMPTAGAYLCTPGKNRVVLPTRTDRTIVEYLQRIGFLGEVVYHEGMKAIVAGQRAAGRRTYSIDDMGAGNDDVAVNSVQDMFIGNSKETVGQLSGFCAPELRKDMFEVTEEDFAAAHEPGRRVFIKTCNTESAGEGIFPVSSLEEFRTELAGIRERTVKYDLNRMLVLQPEVVGVNKSFQIFMHPGTVQTIEVVALTDQLVGDDGKKYAGSINHDLTPERLEIVGPAIIDLVDRLRGLCPDAVGFVMCDYFERPDQTVAIYDPGLRPSSNTGAAMVKRWVEEASGETAGVANSPWFDFGAPGLPYAEIVKRLGDYADPDYILANRLGVLPRGHNHIQGKSRFLIITPERDDYAEFRAELEARII